MIHSGDNHGARSGEWQAAREAGARALTPRDPPRAAPSDVIVLDLITTIGELEALLPRWRALWRRIDDATPFQAPEWLIPWWRHLGRGELCVLALRCGERLVGLVSSTIFHETVGRRARKFTLMGNGVTDYLDALFEPRLRADCAAQTFGYLARLPFRWDLCEFSQLRPESALFDAALPVTFNAALVLHEPCPVLRFHPGARALEDVIPPHQAANVKYYRSRAARFGALEYEPATSKTLASVLSDLFRLHGARWSERGCAGALAEPAVQRFHREVAQTMLDAGMLRLNRLLLNGRVIAVFYGFTHRRRSYFYLGGHDPAFSALSPGTLAIAHALEQALEERVESFDFLRGREPYKYLWGAVDTMTYRRSFADGAKQARKLAAAR